PEVNSSDFFRTSVVGVSTPSRTAKSFKRRLRATKKVIDVELRSSAMLSHAVFSAPTWLFPITQNFITSLTRTRLVALLRMRLHKHVRIGPLRRYPCSHSACRTSLRDT